VAIAGGTGPIAECEVGHYPEDGERRSGIIRREDEREVDSLDAAARRRINSLPLKTDRHIRLFLCGVAALRPTSLVSISRSLGNMRPGDRGARIQKDISRGKTDS
jgi:hypothetical protein